MVPSCVGKTSDGEVVNGKISIPEVAHDTEEDEYVVCSHQPDCQNGFLHLTFLVV